MDIEVLELDIDNNQIVIEITGNNGYELSDFEIKKKLIEVSLDYDLSEEVLFASIDFVKNAEIIRE
jgi:hypothetical protein